MPYGELPREPEDVQEWDREAVRAVPEVLAQAKFEGFAGWVAMQWQTSHDVSEIEDALRHELQG